MYLGNLGIGTGRKSYIKYQKYFQDKLEPYHIIANATVDIEYMYVDTLEIELKASVHSQ